MKITWNWLREFVDLDQGPAETAEALTMAGIEVESLTPFGQGLDRVVVAKVSEVTRHPQAERLHICRVTTGGGELHQIVCGAPDVAAGQTVPLALPGACLPGGKRIEAAELRGVASAGMLCSEADLGLGDDNGSLLQLGSTLRLGDRISDALRLDDWILEISITPNRGDCLSVLGIARELRALCGGRLRDPEVQIVESSDRTADLIRIEIENPKLCSRYAGRVVSGVTVGPSPLWMQYRLKASGMRSLSNVVDATNYLMLERGQPLHAFDYDRLPEKRIVVRLARAGERLRTLDGELRALDVGDIVICSGDTPVALAGVMGGEESEVTDTTRRILLESAWFDPTSVRKTSKRLGLRSEASFRFERCTDVGGVRIAADHAAGQLATLAGGHVAAGVVDCFPGEAPPVPIRLRPSRVAGVLGREIEAATIGQRLAAFGMRVEDGAESLGVLVPTYRSDLSREIDVIEELARALGYENIEATLPRCELSGAGVPDRFLRRRRLSNLLVEAGLDEMVLLSFASPSDNQKIWALRKAGDPVRVINPLTQEDSEMRMSLLPGLLRAARLNVDQGNRPFSGFHIGKVFGTVSGTHEESMRVGGVVVGGLSNIGVGAKGASTEFQDIRGILEAVAEELRVPVRWKSLSDHACFHPGMSASIELLGRAVGVVGRVHPEVADAAGIDANCWAFELDLDTLLDYQPEPVRFKELSKYPAVVRDFALLADARFEAQTVVDFVLGATQGAGLVERVELFDSYQGEQVPSGKKSLAFSVAYRAESRTLTDVEVNEAHEQLISALVARFGLDRR